MIALTKPVGRMAGESWQDYLYRVALATPGCDAAAYLPTKAAK